MIRKFFQILVLFSLFILTSCSFNTLFYKPNPIDNTSKRIPINWFDQSATVVFKDSLKNPIFYDAFNQKIEFPFSIETVYFGNSNQPYHGLILKPKDKKITASIIHYHGNSGHIFRLIKTFSKLLEKGYQVFMFDYSGFGLSKGKVTRNEVYNSAEKAFEFIKTRNDFKQLPLIVYGQSLGGNLATVITEKHQKEIDLLIIEGAFSSHKKIAQNYFGLLGNILTKKSYNAIDVIQNITIPKIIIHSTDDFVVPYEMGTTLYQKAIEPKKFMAIDQCHICGLWFYADTISNEIEKSLKLISGKHKTG